METFKTNVRYNLSKNVNEVNCVGFFKNSFFTMTELIERQKEVYNAYLQNKHNTDKANECTLIYEALEHMRVKLLNNNKK